MDKLMKLAILIFVVITLAACSSSSKTRYRPVTATDGVTAAERDRAIAERDAAIAERDAAVTEFGDDFSSVFGSTLKLAAVTRVPRITGQNVDLYISFNPHQLAGYARQSGYNIGTLGRGTHNPDYLRIRTDAQLYPRDGDAPMLFAATGASTLEFPSRGDVFRTVSFTDTRYPGTRLTIQGTTNAADPWVWRNWEHEVITSFQFTRTGDNPGMVMNFGAADITNAEGVVTGKTGAVFSDLETYAAKACLGGHDRHCNVQNTHDISIGFGGNQPGNPNQDLAYYWKALTPNHHNGRDPDDLTNDDGGGVLIPGQTVTAIANYDPQVFTVTEDVGSYTLELTHAATALNPAADDEDRYLSYAAYGLFNFFDKYINAANGGRLGRLETISYGFDAFADADGMRTTDHDSDITATFKGRTIAYLVALDGTTGARRFVESLTRMRGDVQLTANITTDTSDTDTITGTISNLEYLTTDGHWSQEGHGIVATGGFNFANAFRADNAILTLSSGTIAVDGSYTGVVTPSTAPTTYFDAGAYKGNLYGPVSGLETAGTWWLPAKDSPNDIGVAGVIGSFGACQDGNGRC